MYSYIYFTILKLIFLHLHLHILRGHISNNFADLTKFRSNKYLERLITVTFLFFENIFFSDTTHLDHRFPSLYSSQLPPQPLLSLRSTPLPFLSSKKCRFPKENTQIGQNKIQDSTKQAKAMKARLDIEE